MFSVMQILKIIFTIHVSEETNDFCSHSKYTIHMQILWIPMTDLLKIAIEETHKIPSKFGYYKNMLND